MNSVMKKSVVLFINTGFVKRSALGKILIKSKAMEIFKQTGRTVYMHIDLDVVTNNIQICRDLCDNQDIEIIGVVKGNCYGLGSVVISRHLKEIGVERLAVATIEEGVALRNGGITGPIIVFGSALEWQMARCLEYKLVPTVSEELAIAGMARAMKNIPQVDNATSGDYVPGYVQLKIDTGLTRYGCTPENFDHIVQYCRHLEVPIEGVYTHFADFENEDFTDHQLETFRQCIAPYRTENWLFHASNPGAMLTNKGTDLDAMRPGMPIGGYVPGMLNHYMNYGFRPAMTMKAIPTLVRHIEAGTAVGYGCQYFTQSDEWIGTFAVGYSDGYPRMLEDGYIIRDKTGERCPVVGRVAMDAITVKFPCKPDKDETFTIISADYDPETSVHGWATKLGTISQEIAVKLSKNVPRYYVKNGRKPFVDTMH